MIEISTWIRDRVPADTDLERDEMVRLACAIADVEELWTTSLEAARRSGIVDEGDRYQTGTFTWWTSGITLDPESIPKNVGDPRVGGRIDREQRQQAAGSAVALASTRFQFRCRQRAASAGSKQRCCDWSQTLV